MSPNDLPFRISPEPQMPEIHLRASLLESDAKTNASTNFEWNVTLQQQGGQWPHMQAFNATKHAPIKAKTTGGDWCIPFTSRRGGKLDIAVTAAAKSAKGILTHLSVSTKDLRIVGANPSLADLSTAIPSTMLKQIARHESGLKQFIGNKHGQCACPYFSEDNQGGVGLFQITPPSCDDDIWNWRTNVATATKMIDEKRGIAKRYPALVRHDKTFQALVREFIKAQTAEFAAAKKKANPQATPAELTAPEFVVVLPDFTDDELYDDTIRAFNGLGGTDNLGVASRLHEFEAPITIDSTTGKPKLNATLGTDGKTFTLKWQRVDINRRHKQVLGKSGKPITVDVGDPNYVANVTKQPLF